MFQRTLRQTIGEMGQHTVAILKAEPLQYQLHTVRVAAFKKVSFSDTQNPKDVC